MYIPNNAIKREQNQARLNYAFQQQCQKFYKEWLPQHPEFHCPNNAMTMEWYNGTDIDSPDYQCGVMIPIEEHS